METTEQTATIQVLHVDAFDLEQIQEKLERSNAALQATQNYLSTQDPPPPIELWQVFGALTKLEEAANDANYMARTGRRPLAALGVSHAARMREIVCGNLRELAGLVTDPDMRAALLELADCAVGNG